jgi:tetratricopeptide (TPR) repeat protein
MPESANRAVFLSYTSQDAEAARRICASLRAAGIEVWFDQSELVGGDAWDLKIRQQIRDCTLFIPIVSKTTQGRREGYFRLEWRLADERTHLMAKGTPFLMPVSIDETNDRGALVPDSFLSVQWTKSPGGEAPPAFAGRVQKLLGDPDAAAERVLTAARGESAAPQVKMSRRWLAWAMVGVVGVTAAAIWRQSKSTGLSSDLKSSLPAPPTEPLSEARQFATKARGLFEDLDSTRDDFKLAEDLLVQAQAKDPTDAEVWAALAGLDEQYAIRGFDGSDARRAAAQTAAQRALRFDPHSFEVRFAQAGLLTNTGREGAAKEKLLRQLRQERPRDQRVLRELGAVVDRLGRIDESSALMDESASLPGGDPLALYDKSLNYWFVGRTAEAEAVMGTVLEQKPFAGALLMSVWYKVVLHGDLAGARATLDRIPPETLKEDRGVFFSYYVEYLRRDTDAALDRLRAMPGDWLTDTWYRGPKGRLAGDALHLGGRADAAAAEWREALKLVEARLAERPTNPNLLYNKIRLLASLGDREEAGRQFSVLLQMDGIDPGTGAPPAWVTDICVALGRKAEAIRQVENGLKQERHAVDHTAATLRLDPMWDSFRGDPDFEKLVAEALALEKAGSSPTAVGAAFEGKARVDPIR